MTLQILLSSHLASHDVMLLLTNSADVSVMLEVGNDKNAMYTSLMPIVEVTVSIFIKLPWQPQECCAIILF